MFKANRKGAKESPLKNKPSPGRIAGESLLEHFRDELASKLLYWLVLILVFWLLALQELLRWHFDEKPSPVFAAVLAFGATVVSMARMHVLYKRMRLVAQGAYGERYVGDFLQTTLLPRGYRVLHDLPGREFNVDHVVIGPTGVFAIETKHISRPTSGERQVEYDGKTIRVPGCHFDRDPLTQARASAAAVRNYLRRTTDQDVYVRPVVIFPGWFVAQRVRRPEVWVVNERHYEAWLDHEDDRLTSADIALYAERLRQVGEGDTRL